MSDDLIRRSDAIKAIDKALGKVFVEPVGKKIVNGIPIIKPKQGEWIEWIDCESEVFWKCSACGQVSEASVAGILYKFCPFCGADMRGKDDE